TPVRRTLALRGTIRITPVRCAIAAAGRAIRVAPIRRTLALRGTVRVAAIGSPVVATIGGSVGVATIRRTFAALSGAVGITTVWRLGAIAAAGRSPIRGSAALVRTTVVLTVVAGIAVAGS
ncbi:hypothetical protein, partial [Cryobacterium luteum]|uniref:hypothetical protein n=1 Tax=Cryobacterium luteum TaxID=1424661 RepID=UPI001ABF38BA